MKSFREGYRENYTEMILMFPESSLPKDKSNTGGSFDRSVEKAVKAIKTHSIQTKPERNAGKRNDPKYREWISRTEYNPFLHNAWMLMAKSQFQNGDFLQAAGSFSYIARIYKTQPEIALDAKIWQARCYSEMDWFYEAEDILTKLDQEQLSNRQKNWYATVYADFLIKQKKYGESIPYLKTAIDAEKNKLQKTREKYLLGQIYSLLGEKNAAYNTFGEVSSANAPYILEFSAKIRQTEVYGGTDTTKIVKQLRNMAKSSKNKDYLDQLYYALGNVYMAFPDTLKAIESYTTGVEKSVAGGIDKALNQIRLGDIFFNRKDFVNAQPNYGEALGQLKKEDESYPRVSKRSEILDELIVHIQAVELQDSLLKLSRMSEADRLKVVENLIAELKKKEEEERKLMDREEYLSERENARAEMNLSKPNAAGSVLPPGSENLFYFYNPQVVAQGKNAFQKKWGRRKSEDDWRRRNRTNPMFDPFDEEELAEAEEKPSAGDSIPEGEGPDLGDDFPEQEVAELVTDPYDPQYYLQQIPVTEEDIDAANLIIADGLYNMAVIYKEKLEDIPLALETFDKLNTRYPDHENKLKAYYHVYLIYLKEENVALYSQYKQKIRSEFPDSDYAAAMANPDYERNLRLLYTIPESLYQETYDAYMNGNPTQIRKNYEEMSLNYSQSDLMPKFIFLNALSYVQTNDANEFKEQLKDLIERYPNADVSVPAAEMLKGFQRGLILSASGDNMLARGNLFNIRFGAENGEPDPDISEIPFSDDTNGSYLLLLVYPQGAINENMLLYTVASFNFGNFTVNDFDLEKTTVGQIGLLQMKGFIHFQAILQYLEMIYAPGGYAGDLAQSVLIVPVSTQNYDILMKGKTLDEYMTFFEENFGDYNSDLIERWHLKRDQELEETEAVIEEQPEIEPEPDSQEVTPEEEVKDTKEIISEPIIAGDSIQSDSVSIPSLSELEQKRMEDKMNELEKSAGELFDRSSQTVNEINSIVDEIVNDPVRGIQRLFKRKKSSNVIDEYAKEQERLEKERQKQLKEEKEAEEKALRERVKQKEKEQRELEKQQKEEQKALEKEKKQQAQEKERLKKEEAKAKIEKRKQSQREKEQLRKQKEKERKEKAKEREKARKQREAERKAARKQKEEERKAARRNR
ncbi:MAG: hypothetical protein LBH12_05325 [Dysgonamonadaceae bacterium]|nr:hypothetical protein [Dysgonamonadaceae bacterium]